MNFRQPLIAYNEEEADAYGNIAVAIIDSAADQSLQSESKSERFSGLQDCKANSNRYDAIFLTRFS